MWCFGQTLDPVIYVDLTLQVAIMLCLISLYICMTFFCLADHSVCKILEGCSTTNLFNHLEHRNPEVCATAYVIYKNPTANKLSGCTWAWHLWRTTLERASDTFFLLTNFIELSSVCHTLAFQNRWGFLIEFTGNWWSCWWRPVVQTAWV